MKDFREVPRFIQEIVIESKDDFIFHYEVRNEVMKLTERERNLNFIRCFGSPLGHAWLR
jgi:hypothetical protein